MSVKILDGPPCGDEHHPESITTIFRRAKSSATPTKITQKTILPGLFPALMVRFPPPPDYNDRAMENLTHTSNPTQKTPRTPAQIAASRANGAKSKGPITPEIHFRPQLYEAWQPTDEYERCLVDTML